MYPQGYRGFESPPLRQFLPARNWNCTGPGAGAAGPAPGTMVHRTSRLVALAAAAGACTGPALRIDNPDHHTVFLDGVATPAGAKAFRYYGTTRWDALPADRSDRPHRADWQHLPTSRAVAVPAPVTPWIFPLDFPLELLARLANGREDATAAIEVLPAATDPRPESEIANLELATLTLRARQARASR